MGDRLYLDTNIILDLLGEREPFYEAAAEIATLADEGKAIIVASSLSYAVLFYVLSKFESREIVKKKLAKFKVISETADLTDKIIEKGLSSSFTDFEDALQYYCAIDSGCNVLITRNAKDFKRSDIPVITPDEYLKSLLER